MSCVECPVCGHNDLWDYGSGCAACEIAGRPFTRMVSVRYPTRRDLTQTASGQQRLFPRDPIVREARKVEGFPIPGLVA